MNYIVITACIIVMIYMISRFKGSRYVLGEAIKIQEYMKNKKINDKIVLERHEWKDTKQDVNIDWKNPEPKDYEGKKPNPFLSDEIGHFNPDSINWKGRKFRTNTSDGTTTEIQVQDEFGPNPRLNPNYKEERTVFLAKQQPAEHIILDPEGKIDKSWTEFKERNPELFDTSHPKKPDECFVAGTVLDGTLLVEMQDSKVLRFSLDGNVPPNGNYMIEGELKGTRLIYVTEYQSVTGLPPII